MLAFLVLDAEINIRLGCREECGPDSLCDEISPP